MTTLASPRILVVDDNDDNRYTLTLYLDLEGYPNVETAQDGEEAVALLEVEEFDLVLLDVMMPRLDGYGVLAWLKAKGRLHNIPVIMVSALNEMNSVVRCIELGAVDYLTKPFNPVLLRARLGASLEKKRLRDQVHAHLARLEEELDAARKLQMGMVPQSFPAPGPDFPWDIQASIEPAREVGGDLYDVFRAADGSLCFFIGDVSGKGVSAALLMASIQSALHAQLKFSGASHPVLSTAVLMALISQQLYENTPPEKYATFFCSVYDDETGRLTYTNAGHLKPILVREGQATTLEGDGMVVGLLPNVQYEQQDVLLQTGDLLAVFSDRIPEAEDAAEQEFGEARLAELLAAQVDKPLGNIITLVTGAVEKWIHDPEGRDDLTLLLLRKL